MAHSEPRETLFAHAAPTRAGEFGDRLPWPSAMHILMLAVGLSWAAIAFIASLLGIF